MCEEVEETLERGEPSVLVGSGWCQLGFWKDPFPFVQGFFVNLDLSSSMEAGKNGSADGFKPITEEFVEDDLFESFCSLLGLPGV